jgi:hypothetical protein
MPYTKKTAGIYENTQTTSDYTIYKEWLVDEGELAEFECERIDNDC